MINFWNDLPAVQSRIRECSCLVLFLDFDGTLAPIVDNPQSAYLAHATKFIISQLSRRDNIRIAIVSGRQLEDVEHLVDLPLVDYSGNHGLQWMIRGYRGAVPVPKENTHIKKVLRIFRQLKDLYPSLIIEDKGSIIALHYRRLPESERQLFQSDFERLTEQFIHTPVRFTNNKKVYEYSPDISWSKGDFCTMYLKKILMESREKILPVYAGDDLTDEAAFRELSYGLTIRIEPGENSAARYYLNRQTEIRTFLKYLLNNTQPI